MRLLLLLTCALSLTALDVPPPADPAGLGERLAMLDYLRQRGVRYGSGIDDDAVRALYGQAWQADPAHAAQLAVLLREEAAGQRMARLRAELKQRFNRDADPNLDEAGMRALLQRLDGEQRELAADEARQAAARGELVLQRVRFTDGRSMLGRYDEATARLEVYDEAAKRMVGEVTLTRTTIASVATVTIAIAPQAGASPSAAAGRTGCDGTWLTDVIAARRLAASEHRPVLMLFTGSDWCSWCMKLDKEVFSTPEFRTWASARVVLLYLDYPRQKQLSAEQQQANQVLQQQYGIRGFPSVVFTDAEGKQVGKSGYAAGGAKAWTEACDKQLGSR